MALADYHRRSAVSVAHALRDFDEAAVESALSSWVVEVALSPETERTREGEALADMLVRLAARLYPRLVVRASPAVAAGLAALAARINPNIEVLERLPDGPAVSVGVGRRPPVSGSHVIYAGSARWVGTVSAKNAQTVGASDNPFGAGVAAALSMAQVFKTVFLGEAPQRADVSLPAVPGRPVPAGRGAPDDSRIVLVGAGAIGNAALWALGRLPERLPMAVVDPESIELSNLQRYVLAERADVGAQKVSLARRALPEVLTFPQDWQAFVVEAGHRQPIVAVSVDSAEGRRAVQASLPEWVVNAWTQPGDLGVSHHTFDGDGACLACLYLPTGQTKSEDVIYAEALAIPDQLMQVRALLDRGDPVPDALLDLIGQRLRVEQEAIMSFSGRPLRELYTEGICGGAVLPVGHPGQPRPEVHVPLAHQSALAGVMLAARLFVSPRLRRTTLVSRVNVLGDVDTRFITQPASRDPRGICICQDRDYQKAYTAKYRS